MSNPTFQVNTDALYIELDTDRRIRHRNKLYYRFNHWPIWIFVFFIAPGPLTFTLFERGFDSRLIGWLGAVLVGTAIAALCGRLPGCESSGSPKTVRTRCTGGSATRQRGAKWWRSPR
jgi:hypothetical protein